jgi:hypothetical protein
MYLNLVSGKRISHFCETNKQKSADGRMKNAGLSNRKHLFVEFG